MVRAEEIRDVTDVIDLSYLQQIQDSVGELLHITMALLAPDGTALSQPTNLHAFCAMMLTSEQGNAMCMQSYQQLIAENIRTRKTAYLTCPNSGLMTASVPIFLQDHFLGCWLIGQIRVKHVDLELVKTTAVKAGLSKEQAVQTISGLPVTTQKEFQLILDFLGTVTCSLTDMVQANHVLDLRNDELTETTKRLDLSLKAFSEFIKIADMGAYLVNFESGEIIMYNEVYRTLTGLDHHSLLGTCCFEHMHQPTFCSFCPKDKLLGEDGEPGDPVIWENYNEVTEQWLQLTSRALRWVDGSLALMTTFQDISERKREEQRIAYLAYHDQWLNIYNGIKLFEDIQENQRHELSLICFDIVGMREINNVYGREAGDLLLSAVVDWVQEITVGRAELYRLQSDDFALLMLDYAPAAAKALAEQIFARFESAWPVTADGVTQHVYINANVGVVELRGALTSYAELLNLVEQILYHARGIKKPVVYDDTLRKKDAADTRLRIKLKECIVNGMQGFFLHYQPLVAASTGKWRGIEVLCRWSTPELGSISPGIFIPEVEKIGLIRVLTDWIVEGAIRQVKEWRLDELSGFVLDVNISPIELRDRTLLPNLLALLKKYDYPSEKLSLEITETAEVHFDEQTMRFLQNVRAAGISFTLDDFGIGYATFSQLQNLPVSVLKTDRSFIQGIEHDPFARHVMRTIVELAHAAGILVVAEGVETAAQRRIVRETGVNLIQGYYYSRPLGQADMELKLGRFFEDETV